MSTAPQIEPSLDAYLAILESIQRDKAPCLIDFMYQTQENRDSYAKHMLFLNKGADYTERLFMAANRIGKTEGAGGYELSLHLTGEYPEWWTGKRFEKPIIAWAAGDTRETTRDILQKKIVGERGKLHENKALVHSSKLKTTSAGFIPDSFSSVKIRHKSGGISTLHFKSYDQGRQAFQGTEIDCILLDEEPPLDVYTECLTRLMTTKGLMLITFTPLSGMSETVTSFFTNIDGLVEVREGEVNGRYVVMAGWDDVPHLDEATKERMLASYPPFMRLARSKGLPQMGSGVIYPVSPERYTIEPFEIPPYFKHVYGMDVGWNVTACVWGAYDEKNDIIYIYSEHVGREATPLENSHTILAKGDWIKGVVDPASQGRNQKDGTRLIDEYIELGLDLTPADNTVEAGIMNVWTRFSTDRIKIFTNCRHLLSELTSYSRDEKGKIIKKNDHLCDSLRYLCVSGLDVAEHEYKQNQQRPKFQQRTMVV